MSPTEPTTPRSDAMQIVQACTAGRIERQEAVARLVNLGYDQTTAYALVRAAHIVAPQTDDTPVTGLEPELPGQRVLLREEPFAEMRVRLVGDGMLYLMENTFDLRGYGSGSYRDGHRRYWDVWVNLPEHRFPAWHALHLEIRLWQNAESP